MVSGVSGGLRGVYGGFRNPGALRWSFGGSSELLQRGSKGYKVVPASLRNASGDGLRFSGVIQSLTEVFRQMSWV